MNDAAKILAELKKRAADSAHQEQLIRLFQEIIARFESNSSPGVTSLLQERMNRLQDDFNQTYSALRSKMGEAPERDRR